MLNYFLPSPPVLCVCHAPCLFALVCVKSGSHWERQCAIGGADLAVVHRQRWLLIDAHAHDMPHSWQAEGGEGVGEGWRGYWQSGLELLMLHIINLLCCCRCSKLPLAMSSLIYPAPLSPLSCPRVYDAFMAALAISAKWVASCLVVSSVISFAFEIAQEIDWVGKVAGTAGSRRCPQKVLPEDDALICAG